MENLLEMQKNVKAIVRKHENNLIKLNVEVLDQLMVTIIMLYQLLVE